MSQTKELGSLQKKVLYFLAENPNSHKQGIQKGIKSDQYGSIVNVIDPLKENGYIKSKGGISQKRVKIELYSCTEKGVSYVLTNNPEANIPKILDNYKEEYPIFERFIRQYDIWGRSLFVKFYGYLGRFGVIWDKRGLENTVPMFLMIYNDVKNFTPEEIKKLLNVLKENPDYKAQAKIFKDILETLL